MRHTAAAVLTVVCLALAGCSSGGEPDKKPTSKPAPTPSPTRSLSQAEVMSACSEAVAEAAPGWEDWNFDAGAWADDPRTPEACLALKDEEFPPRGNRAFQDALIDGLEMADDPRAGS